MSTQRTTCRLSTASRPGRSAKRRMSRSARRKTSGSSIKSLSAPDSRAPLSRHVFGSDRGLQARMLLTMLLLGALYAAAIIAVVRGGAGAAGVLGIAALVAGVHVFASDKLALAMIGARQVSPAHQPKLHAVIERLCVQADIPKPRIALVDTKMPNAFAIGRSRNGATVCVTTGLVSLLTPAELEGVLAHELTHVVNRDMLVLTIASFLTSITAVLARFILRFGTRGGHPLNQLAAAVCTFLFVTMGYVVSFVLVQALSRYREFAADRGAAIITGRPSALSSALMKIDTALSGIPDRDLRATAQMNAFFILPARRKTATRGLCASHPPLDKRLAALAHMEAELQQPRAGRHSRSDD
jgi:heat shock protein HtpX